jgi:pyridoxine/pyridoxamine 5'-phosphate oxidase
MTKDELYAFMQARRFAVVSSLHADGAPESALVGYAVTPELEILFDTTDATRKCANLRRDPRIAIVISWVEEEQTLQYEGIADEPRDEELERLKKVYFTAFPDGVARQEWPGLTYFRARPRWIRYSSYVRPQHIEEFTF